jgi:hypothetical protein
MNYKKIHDAIIENAKNRVLTGYKENHHVIPKCLGGGNEKENIVSLTAKEHFIIHALLCEIYPNNNKLEYALWMMINCKSKNHNRDFKVSSRLYEKLRQIHSKNVSNRMSGSNNPMFGNPLALTKDNSGEKNPMFGKRGKDNPNTGKKCPKQSEKLKIDNPMFRPEVVEKVKIKLRGPRLNARKPKKKIQCPYCEKAAAPHLVYRYHFNNCPSLRR